MIYIDFLTSSERRELVACMRRHREDHGVARRTNAILLLDDGKSCQANAEFLYLDDDTIRGWLGRPFDRRLERRSVLRLRLKRRSFAPGWTNASVDPP